MHRLWLLLILAARLLPAADSSLVLHLKLNEGHGDQARDSSGRNHHAKLVNVEWVDRGLEGRAIRLTGDQSYVELPQHDDFGLSQDFTLLLWMKVGKFEKHGLSLFVRGNYVKGWQTYVYRSFIAMSSRSLSKGLVHYTRFPAGTPRTYPFTQIAITGRRADDRSTAISFYVNGRHAQTFTVEGRLPVSPHALSIGKFASNEGVYFNGVIDEVKIYSRPLSVDEIQGSFQEMNRGIPTARASAPAIATPLPEVELKSLQKRRVAIFAPAAGFPGKAIRDVPWLEQELANLGLRVTALPAADLVRTDVLTTECFDTLILPTANIPFEAEYSVYQFLSAGGNLITASCTPTTWKAGVDGKMEHKQHRRGWFAPFLIRHLDFPWAQRRVDQPVTLNPAAARLVGNLLPRTAGPCPKRRYSLVDRWDLQPCAPGQPGDTDVTGGENLFAAADVMLPLYERPNQEPTDFHVYRYFNTHLSGATLIELGAVGSELLASESGADVLKALLHLAESKLPGENPPDYYARINRLHQDWSKLGDTYVDTLVGLRDAAHYSHLIGAEAWKEFNRQAAGVESRMTDLIRRKKAWDQSLLNGSSPTGITETARELLTQIAAASRDFVALQRDARTACQGARTPARVPVKSPYGELLVEGFLTLPTNLTMLRTWHFPAMKRIGVNLYSKRMHPWYSRDPEIRRQMSGIVRDLNFQYGVTVMLKPHSGEINPADGTVRDAEPQEYDYAKAEEYIKRNLANLYGYPALRIGLAHETGLGLKYWGSQAQQDFRAYLAQEYPSLAALNEHWGTQYPDFAAIELPTRRPATPAQHAAWEHWRNLREAKFEHYLKAFYDIVKKHAPELAVSGTVSTGSLQSPLYGVNFYNVTRYQDISGIDGTAVNPPKEWLYLDLTKKRVLTCEWGGLYHPASLAYVNGKLWEELTGGSLGFNLWIWQFGDCECNYVNFAGLPTLYGSQACATVADAKKIEHVILDGHRASPEIGILFSQTTRCHDQAWGAKGEKTFSPHVQAVTNYYAHFLKFHRSARVIAEEKLLEDDVDYLKLLIVPQATFLSERVQRRLLEYAQNGGKLLLEGRVGQSDNFGKRLDLLFRAGQIAPAHTTVRDVTVGSASWPTAADDPIFAPTALTTQARAVARFGTKAAILARPLGKGQIVVMGLAAGLRHYQYLPALLNAVWRDQKLTPRFMVSDDAVLLREWRHGSDTYLLLTSRTSEPAAFPLEVKVRGDCRIEDYLFGRAAKGQFDGSYTTFNTLMSNGGRVFRMPNSAPADSIALWSATPSTATKTDGQRDGQAVITLPFKGRIYAATALKWGDYTFRNSTIASGIDAEQGETYLSISKGAEVQKKRIRAGGDYYFRMRGRTFRVRCSMNFYKFPFHSKVSIDETEAPPPEAACRIETQGRSITVSTGLLQLKLDPDRGGRITEIALTDDQINQVASHGALSACTENVGRVPGPFVDRPFEPTIVKDGKDEIVLELANQRPIDRKTLRKTLTARRSVAGFQYGLKCINHDPRPVQPSFELRWHPELVIGGLTDEPDVFVVPTPEGVRRLPYQANLSGVSFKPGADWAAIVDRGEKLAYVTTFRRAQVGRIYLWQDAQFYDLEIFSPRRQVKTGDSIDLDLGVHLLRGLSGLDIFRDGYGVHAALADNFDQREPVGFAVEVGSAYRKIQPVRLTARLRQGDRTITDFGGEVVDTVAFDQPINRAFHANLTDCADGAYQLCLTVRIAESPALTVLRELHLSGAKRAEHLRYYEKCKASLEALAGSEVAIFDLRVSLEEFRSDIAAGRLAAAAARRAGLAKAVAGLRRPVGQD